MLVISGLGSSVGVGHFGFYVGGGFLSGCHANCNLFVFGRR